MVDRKCNYGSHKTTIGGFINLLKNKVKAYNLHYCIYQSQQAHMQQSKDRLEDGALIIHMDFSENMECIVQEEVSSNYYSRSKVSLFTAVIYRLDNGILRHQSHVVASDDISHGLCHVLLALREIRKLASGDEECGYEQSQKATLWNPFENARIVHFFSDGARQHFKNKSALWFLSHHRDLFGCEATWSFTASGHGKSACDGVGGVLKSALRRFALRENKCRANNEGIVMNARSVRDWNIQKYTNFVSHIQVGLLLKHDLLRFREEFTNAISGAARRVPDVSTYHHFTCQRPGVIRCHKTALVGCSNVSTIDAADCENLVNSLKMRLNATR